MESMNSFENLKVFIVDDDPFSRMLYHQHLLNLGFKNNCLFENGPDCIEQLSQQPDIIFLDYDMKPYNGLEILKIIKEFNPGIFLLVVSAQKDVQIAIKAIKFGAYDYIAKGKNDLEMISKVVNNIAMSKELTCRLKEISIFN
jgi:DNA-binding NtrC family response regulator